MTEQTEQQEQLSPTEWVQKNYGPTNELTHKQMVFMLKCMCYGYESQKNCAKALGISEQYLSDILNGKRGIGPTVLLILGFEKEPVYLLRGTP